MDLSPEQKINMSLEDLISAQNQKNKQKRASKQPAAAPKEKKTGGLVITKPRSAAGKARRPNNRRPNSANSANTNNTVKVAKSVGTGKANRNASINQRRGLNASGKATKMEIESEVNKQKNKRVPGGGLKITFRPKELTKTTDRNVSQQIRAVLSRQSNRGPKADGSNKSVGSRGSAASGNTRNPRVRAKNTVLKVNR